MMLSQVNSSHDGVRPVDKHATCAAEHQTITRRGGGREVSLPDDHNMEPILPLKDDVKEKSSLSCPNQDATSPRLSVLQRVFIFGGLFILFLGFSPLLPRDWRNVTVPASFRLPDLQRYTPKHSDSVGTVKTWTCPGYSNTSTVDCGSIIVPKDYFDEDAGIATIVFARLKATTQPKKGTVFFNCGGPGGRCSDSMLGRSDTFRTLIPADYDVIGFDPRGIGRTTPKVNCFADREDTYVSFSRNTVLERGYDFASNMTAEEMRTVLVAAQREADALLKAQFDVCRRSPQVNELKYMGTATVVRDIDFMTNIFDGKDADINFFGGSYGSIMGMYLVNMLPQRVGKVLIDGIANVEMWSNDPPYTWYSQWLSSTEDAFDQFVGDCATVGPEFCALARHDTDAAGIRKRLEDFLDSLYYKPLPVSNSPFPGLLTSGRARNYLFTKLQRPMVWHEAAEAFSHAYRGSPEQVYHGIFQGYYPYRDLERSAVTCNDNLPFASPSAEEYIDSILMAYKKSTNLAFSVITTEPDSGCQFWPVTPPERFLGPWNHTLKNPMLVVSNTADPVTPIASGRRVQELMGDSARLLVQDSPGHTSLSLPSLCTAKHVKAYFADGRLPPEGTVCAVDEHPFPDLWDLSPPTSPDEELLDKLRSLSSIWANARYSPRFESLYPTYNNP